MAGANQTPPDGTTPQMGAEALRSDDGHATSNRRIVGEITPKFARELPLRTAKPTESPIRSISNADWDTFVQQWSLSPEDGQLLYGLEARGTFNPEGGTAMPKESHVSSISNADWNALVRQWKVSHGQLPNIPAGGAFIPNGGKSMI